METITEATREEKKEIARTILQQMGGNRFLSMTGAKVSYGIENNGNVSLNCKFTGCSKINHVTVTYMYETDTYKMIFHKIRYNPIYSIAVIEDYMEVYGEDLQRFFTDVTGLYTTL